MSPTGAPGEPQLNLRGAVDLSNLGKGPAGGVGATGVGGSGWVLAVNEAELNDVVQQSLTVPVLLGVWTPESPESKDLMDTLGEIVNAADGRLLLATLDAAANPSVLQALGVQAVPMVMAIVKGQPVPLFQGVASQEQIMQVLAQVVAMAEQNGVNGKIPPVAGGDGEPDDAAAEEPPSKHAAALDALAAGDVESARAAFADAVAADPGDDEARQGLAQVDLMERVQHMDADAVRSAVAQNPSDPEAVMAVADLDLVGGHVEDCFARLIDAIAAAVGDEKNTLRDRLLHLFDVVGATDERVLKARRSLASALF